MIKVELLPIIHIMLLEFQEAMTLHSENVKY